MLKPRARTRATTIYQAKCLKTYNWSSSLVTWALISLLISLAAPSSRHDVKTYLDPNPREAKSEQLLVAFVTKQSGVSPFVGHFCTHTALAYYWVYVTSKSDAYGTISNNGKLRVAPGCPQTRRFPSTPEKILSGFPVASAYPETPKNPKAHTTRIIAQNISVHSLSLTRPFLIGDLS